MYGKRLGTTVRRRFDRTQRGDDGWERAGSKGGLFFVRCGSARMSRARPRHDPEPTPQPHSYCFDLSSLVIAFRYTDRIITLSFCCYALDGCRVVVVSYRHSEPINEYEDKTTSSLLSDLTNSPWLYSTRRPLGPDSDSILIPNNAIFRLHECFGPSRIFCCSGLGTRSVGVKG